MEKMDMSTQNKPCKNAFYFTHVQDCNSWSIPTDMSHCIPLGT